MSEKNLLIFLAVLSVTNIGILVYGASKLPSIVTSLENKLNNEISQINPTINQVSRMLSNTDLMDLNITRYIAEFNRFTSFVYSNVGELTAIANEINENIKIACDYASIPCK